MFDLLIQQFRASALQSLRPLHSGASVTVLTVSLLTLASCEASKDRKPAQKPSTTASPSPSTSPEVSTPPGTTNTGGNGNPTNNNGAAPVAGDAAYMTPRARPSKVNNPGSSSARDVTANDVFVTPVYLDSTSWLKICATLTAEGTAAPFLVGCTHEATAAASNGVKQASAQNPKFVLDSPLTVGLTEAGKRLSLKFKIYAQESNAGCGSTGCPGPFTKELDSASKSTDSTPASIKCIKSGNVLVLFIDDKQDKDVAADAAFRAKLTPSSGTGSVPQLPNLRNLHDPALLNVMYNDPGSGSKISEKDVRRKFGVDFDDLILQVDLGTSGHKLAGYESCN